MNKETCTKCGMPIWVCRSNDPDLGFSVRTDVCYVSRTLETYQDKKGDKLKKGEYAYPVTQFYRERTTVPSRMDYLRSKMEDDE